MTDRKRNKTIIKTGLNLLKVHKDTLYSQRKIKDKLALVNCIVSDSTITNFNKIEEYEQKGKGFKDSFLQIAAKGFEEVIQAELCLAFDDSNQKFSKKIAGCQPIIIVDSTEKIISKEDSSLPNFKLSWTGRLQLQEKLRLIKAAQKEVKVVGVRLNSWVNYFKNRSDSEFRNHIITAMEKGVNFNCYSMHPKNRFAHDFFKDRAKIQQNELRAFEEMPIIFNDLKEIQQELNSLNLKGKMTLFQYQTYPYFYALTADIEAPIGGLQLSSYLFGIKRSNIPVVEVWKQQNPELFNIYAASITSFSKLATSV